MAPILITSNINAIRGNPMMDGTWRHGNRLAVAQGIGDPSRSGSFGGFNFSSGIITDTGPYHNLVLAAKIRAYCPVMAGRFAMQGISFCDVAGVWLDTTANEFLDGTGPGPSGSQISAGCNAVWLESGALVALYRTRPTTASAWSYWWRKNDVGGRQSSQPTITGSTMGNWSEVGSLTIPTTDFIQITRGQDRIVGLYNTGTLKYDRYQDGVGGSFYNVYTRTAGNLYCTYALDDQLQTWSTGIQIATGVAPHFGGLCYTGSEWVCCYTTNSILGSMVIRSARLDDWSLSVPTTTDNGATSTGFQNNDQSAYTADGPGSLPPMTLHCMGLAYDERNIMNGVWINYEDTPRRNLISPGFFADYGMYFSMLSGDQGRTWQLGYNEGNTRGRLAQGYTCTTVDGRAHLYYGFGQNGSSGQASETSFHLDSYLYGI